nr:hypothetical protein [uncultured Draconibacterium sp.]
MSDIEMQIAIEGLKQLIRELAQEKYQHERNGMAKAALDFVDVIENQANGVKASEATATLPRVTASILKDKNSFENDMAAATLKVMLKHKVVTGYKGDFGRWIECETKFKYLHNAGGIYVEDLDFAATESDYHR